MEARANRWWNESWIPIAAGWAWLATATEGGTIQLVLAGALGSLLLASGVACLVWPGDARARHFAAISGLAGVLLGAIAFAWVGLAFGLGLIALSAGSAWAAGRLSIRALGSYEDVPEPGMGVQTSFEAALDAAVLAQMTLTASPHALRGDGRRVHAEVLEALALYRERGWLEKPASYHATPPALEDPELRPARSRGVEYEHVRFESGYAPHPDEPGRERYLAYAPCRTAHAWMLRHSGADRPWLICIHGYQMGTPLVDFGAFRPEWLHHRLGMNLLLPVLPMHGPRKIRRVSGDGFLAGDLLDTVHALAQTGWDLRRLLSWVRTQTDSPIGAYGLSLGGYSTALFASLADDLAGVVAGIPATDFARLSWRHGPPDELRKAEEAGVGLGETAELKRVISPLVLEPRVPKERRYIFGGSSDLLVSPDLVRDLWRHWGRPAMCWYPGAHITFAAHPPVRRFIETAFAESSLIP